MKTAIIPAEIQNMFTPEDHRMLKKIQESAALFGYIVKAMRQGVSMSLSEMALATGIGRKRLVAIEKGLPGSQGESDLISRAIVDHVLHLHA